MALGEYVSVSSQRDSERAEIAQEKGELAAAPDADCEWLVYRPIADVYAHR
jgi:VIT1/CCC1 family predicted Fe2+/Mn2+ transporter